MTVPMDSQSRFIALKSVSEDLPTTVKTFLENSPETAEVVPRLTDVSQVEAILQELNNVNHPLRKGARDWLSVLTWVLESRVPAIQTPPRTE